jgi:hypothetical protein
MHTCLVARYNTVWVLRSSTVTTEQEQENGSINFTKYYSLSAQVWNKSICIFTNPILNTPFEILCNVQESSVSYIKINKKVRCSQIYIQEPINYQYGQNSSWRIVIASSIKTQSKNTLVISLVENWSLVQILWKL